MKPGLKRIEATLDQLSTQSSLPNQQRQDRQDNPDSSTRSGKARKKAEFQPPQEVASRIQTFPLPEKSAEPPLASPPPNQAVNQAAGKNQVADQVGSSSARVTKVKRTPSPKRTGTATETVKPFSTQDNCSSIPSPKPKPLSLSSHRHATNPNLAMGMLKEIEAIVAEWQRELEQVVRQIQALYQEGPIVDGWLESQSYEPHLAFQSVGVGTLRHAEIEHLMDFVEQICSVQQPQDAGQSAVPGAEEQGRTGYRLCGLDADGQLWSRPCPPQQVPYVGLAIARYQKLRILLGKKQGLENRLHYLVQTLTLLHGQLQQPL